MQVSDHQKALIKANLVFWLSGKGLTTQGNQPLSDHQIPEDFSSVAVATSENPQSDTYILSQLAELGVKRVRIDFTYDDFDQPAGRLLNKLIKAGYRVHLHLIQPFDEAKAMEEADTQSEWRNFVEKACEDYGQQLALIEVGSTVNRKRWAGYDLSRLIKAWEIAHNIIKKHGITLAGPNITDFEPVYNVGLLSAFSSRNLLPDIHTNNLFSERCTEPERDDHKILGRKLASIIKFKLIKKAHLLNKISQHFGVPDWHSPAAFWTLPRIERLLPDSLEKQADYLSRYFVLCAASGTMQSAGWGPLICHREGMIDDQITPYPALERITHYLDIGANVEQYHLRPAFKAFKQFNNSMQGAHYIGKVPSKEGLEIHAFTNDAGYWHVAWTINSKAAIFADIYGEGIQPIEVINRNGEKIDLPDLVSESPIFCLFNSPPKSTQNAGVISHCSIHYYTPETAFFAYQKDQWRGLIAAKDRDEFSKLAKTLEPTQLTGPTQDTTLRKARNAIWTIPDPRDPEQKIVVKQPVKVPWFKKVTDYFKPSKGLRSWTGANELLRRGIDNAKPIAYFELVGDNKRTQNFYLCEYVAADCSVRDLFSHYAKGEASYEGIEADQAIPQIADFLHNMHQRGVFFRDLSGGNILVTVGDNQQLSFSLIDTGRAHFFNHPTSLPKRLSDMARACNKLDTDGRNMLMQYYMSLSNHTFGWREKLPFILYNAKVVVKRKTKLKNILKLLGLKKKTKF